MKSTPSLQPRVLVGKTMAALGAFCLVLSFALASLMPPDQSLAELLVQVQPGWTDFINAPELSGAAGWLWQHIAVPVLTRPDWLLPTMLGVICVGIAAQITWGQRSTGRK